MTIRYPPSTNAIQKTLDAQLLSGITASMTLNNVTGIQNKAGVCVVDLIDANEAFTPAKREYISFTGVSGSTLTGLTRNADGGGSDQDHAVGAIVQFPSDVLQQQAIIDDILVQHADGGVHTDALVTSLKATGAVVNTGTSDVTIVTPKALADSNIKQSIDEDDMASNSDTKVPTQQSTKAYVDSQKSAALTETNKRIQKRVDSQTTTDTITPEISTYDIFVRTAQAHALVINNHSTSTPAEGEMMLFEITSDATPRAITYGNKYLAKAGVALPSTTVASKTTTLLFKWSAGLAGWNLLAKGQEA